MLKILGDGFRLIRGNGAEKFVVLERITIFVRNPVVHDIRTCVPTVLPSKSAWGNATLVCNVWACAVTKKGEEDLSVAIGSSEVKRC